MNVRSTDALRPLALCSCDCKLLSTAFLSRPPLVHHETHTSLTGMHPFSMSVRIWENGPYRVTTRLCVWLFKTDCSVAPGQAHSELVVQTSRFLFYCKNGSMWITGILPTHLVHLQTSRKKQKRRLVASSHVRDLTAWEPTFGLVDILAHMRCCEA